jgi:Fur family ferric uptake transcriptional regulator
VTIAAETGTGDAREVFRRFMAERGLKSTSQRQAVVDAFLATHEHVSLEDLHQKVRETNPHIGFTTVYRTLKLLAECGVAQRRSFGPGTTLYEVAHAHHDHLICTACGRIVEFEEPRIEQLQEEVAHRHRFSLSHHKHELYGLCSNCADAPRDGWTELLR